jgi:hypothetical protein
MPFDQHPNAILAEARAMVRFLGPRLHRTKPAPAAIAANTSRRQLTSGQQQTLATFPLNQVTPDVNRLHIEG